MIMATWEKKMVNPSEDWNKHTQMAIYEYWANHHSAFLYFFSFLPLNRDPLSSCRVPTVVNSPHLLSTICINALPFQEQKENGKPPERMLFLRENPKDKLGSFVKAAKKRAAPCWELDGATEGRAVPHRRVSTALRCHGLSYNEHTVFFFLSVNLLWAQR